MAKVLYFDIETAPNRAYVWGQWEQNVIAHDREWYMLCFSYKWEDSKQVRAVSLPDFFETYSKDPEDDSALVQALWQILDTADVVIAHNGDKFDLRKANARFVQLGLPPVSPAASIDTLKLARKHFMFNSNALGNLGEHLGLGKKAPTGGFELWEGCMLGEPAAWKKMVKYAKQDVVLLEQVYKTLRPWAKTHPNLAQIDGRPEACPRCSAEGSLTRRGFQHTIARSYDRFQCRVCRGYSRAATSDSVNSNYRSV